MKIVKSFTNPHVDPKLYAFFSVVKNEEYLEFFSPPLELFSPPLDSKKYHKSSPYTTVQKFMVSKIFCLKEVLLFSKDVLI